VSIISSNFLPLLLFVSCSFSLFVRFGKVSIRGYVDPSLGTETAYLCYVDRKHADQAYQHFVRVGSATKQSFLVLCENRPFLTLPTSRHSFFILASYVHILRPLETSWPTRDPRYSKHPHDRSPADTPDYYYKQHTLPTMARLMVRSKSHQKLREDAQRAAIKSRDPVPNETARPVLSPPASKYASPSPASTPSFEVLSRPKTASAAMEEARKRNLMALGDPISVTDGKETFNFPTPAKGSTPPPLLMSRYANSPLAVRPNLERSNTPETIGIALGSPSHLAQFENHVAENINERVMAFNKDSREVTPAVTPRLGEAQEQKVDEAATQATKPKLSRWKSIFGRKAQQPRELKSQDEPSPLLGSQPRTGLGLNGYHTWEQASPRSPRLRSETMPHASASPQAPPKSPRWNLGRSQTAPIGRRNANSPTVPPKDFLAVEIPETKMERYSIMFNGILPNQPGGLLARRQSKRENKNATPVVQPATLEVRHIRHRKSNRVLTSTRTWTFLQSLAGATQMPRRQLLHLTDC
jgi:hypothetical protein